MQLQNKTRVKLNYGTTIRTLHTYTHIPSPTLSFSYLFFSPPLPFAPLIFALVSVIYSKSSSFWIKTHSLTCVHRGRKSLEARGLSDDERIQTLEKQLAEAQIIAEDADRRYDEV